MLSKVTVMWCLLVTRWVCVDAVTLAVENYSFGAYIFNLLPSTSDSMFARQSRRWTVGCSFRLMTLWYESVFLYLPICKKYGIEHKQNLLLTNFSLLLWHMKKSRSWISRTVTHFYLFEYLVVVPKFWLCRVPHFINFDYMYVNLLCHSNSFYIHPFSRYIWRTLISLHIIRQIM